MIRLLEASDMADFAPIGAQLFSESPGAYPGTFDADFFSSFWSTLIDEGVGVVFGAWDEKGVPVGGIGGVVGPDQCNGEPVLVECFWYVDPDHRQGRGLELFKRFMEFGEKVSVRQVATHLILSMPEKLKRFYMRQGFRLLEQHYIRDEQWHL